MTLLRKSKKVEKYVYPPGPLPDGTKKRPTEFIEWKESVERLEIILKYIKKEKRKSDVYQRYSYILWQLILEAQRDSLVRLNDKRVNSPLPWNIHTGLPSHPTMLADIKVSAQKRTRLHKILLNSCREWALFSEGHMMCSCVSHFRKRNIPFRIKINNSLEKKDKKLFLIQYIGIESGYPKNLNKHFFDFSCDVQMQKNTKCVYYAESTADIIGGITVPQKPFGSSVYFNFEEFIVHIEKHLTQREEKLYENG